MKALRILFRLRRQGLKTACVPTSVESDAAATQLSWHSPHTACGPVFTCHSGALAAAARFAHGIHASGGKVGTGRLSFFDHRRLPEPSP